MSQMVGADADALDRLAHAVGRDSARVRKGAAQLSRGLGSVPWEGRTADRFRQQWSHEYRRSMLDAAAFLDEAGTALRRNAAEQRAASNSSSSGPFGQNYCSVTPGGKDGVGKSWFEKWIDGFSGPIGKALRDILGIIGFGLDVKDLYDVYRLFKVVKAAGELPILGTLFDVLNIGVSTFDLLFDHGYDGQFVFVESYLDMVSINSSIAGLVGAALLPTPLWPVGGVIIATSAVVGIGAWGVDMGLEYWATGGGREKWGDFTKSVSSTWNDVRSTAGDTYRSVTSTASDVYRSATSTVSRAVDDVSKPFRDAGAGLKDLATSGLGLW